MKTITEIHLPFRLRKITSNQTYVIDTREYSGAVEIRPQVGCSNPDEEKAIGDFIVRACNSHERLVEACRQAKQFIEDDVKIMDLSRVSRTETNRLLSVLGALGEVLNCSSDADAVVVPEKNTLSMASKVCTALQARNVLCHLEYQEWINIPMGDGFHWAFGDMNEFWDGHLNAGEGDNLAILTLDFRNDHQSDGKDIADAIYEALRKFDHHAFGAPPFEPNES